MTGIHHPIELAGERMPDPRRGDVRPLIGVAAEAYCLRKRQPVGLCSALRRAGYAPVLLDPEDPAAAPLQVIDLIVARGRGAPLLALLARAEGTGVRTVNRCSAIAQIRDRSSMVRELAAAGLSTPATFSGSIVAIAAAFHAREYPIVLKPPFAEGSRSPRIVRSRAELLSLDWPDPIAVAQRLVPSDGFDLRLYVIGGQVFAVRRPSPLTGSPAAPRHAITATPAMRALALRCGLLFGLELYSITCVEMAAGLQIVGVTDFPDYEGVTAADEKLARFVIERACASLERRRP
jgi:glutathione synthase/RimK-type ligase-like ATP-grasp enzyme